MGASPARSARAARWLEAAFRVPAARADDLGALLVDAGSHGVITGVRDFRRPARAAAHQTIRGFFPSDAPEQARRAVSTMLRAHAPRTRVRWRLLDAELWEIDWREHFQPITAGRRLVVVPPWERAAHAGRRRIVIHPGMAFGTGQHATTHGCLDAIDTLTASASPPARALDVGTGTAVLAIALAKLGARRVLAIDTDPQAVTAARDNVRRNQMTARVRVSVRPLPWHAARARARYPLAVANLYLDALVALEPTLAGVVAPGGHLVTSGILHTQAATLRRAYASARWSVVRARRRGPWVTTVFQRRVEPKPRRRGRT